MQKKILVYTFLIIHIILLNVSNLLAQQPATYSSAELYLKIKSLKVLGSVLYIAAHPDDENNGLLPYLTKEKLYRTAYLSLTRGEGGQNLIGSEQGVDLGLIRTQELLAARKIDGAEQYFTRTYEFGYSKTSNETLHIWDSVAVLSDIVWCIRKFKPDVIITRFPPDARAGHGHHAASAILANIAFSVAADKTKFTEQFNYGVQPHQAKRILWNTFNFGNVNTTNDKQLKIDFNQYNSLLGKSYGEIGAEARTMHKSQGEGRPRRRGQLFEYFNHTAGDSATKDLMDDIDISWKKITSNAANEREIDNIIQSFNFEKPELSVKPLVNVYKEVKSLSQSVWRDYKLNEIKAIIESCSGLFMEATTTQDYVVQGDSLRTSFFINKRKDVAVNIENIGLDEFDTTTKTSLQQNKNFMFNKNLFVANDKALTQPYWLKQPQQKGMFVVNEQEFIGNPESKPAYEARFTVNIEGENFEFVKPVLYKYVDLVKGELYQPLQVFPVATIDVDDEEKLMTYRKVTDGKFAVKNFIKNNTITFKNGMPKDLKYSNDSLLFTNESEQKENHYISYNNNEQQYLVEGNTLKNVVVNKTLHQIKYDHIPTITYFTPSKFNTHKIDVIRGADKIAYIVGAGDKMPEALQQLGYSVDIITEKDITIDNLKKYQAIVTGIRAYNVVEYLGVKNEVLNEYVKQGGNLIIQYLRGNTFNNKKINISPYTFTVSSQSRVTEENAKVNFALPNHSVFNYPNKISEKDFEGWIQERSTYQIDKADSNFIFPITMNDTNEKPGNGSLAIASYGKGNVVYCSLAMFRQLPAGVTGAYRLMANLISLPLNK